MWAYDLMEDLRKARAEHRLDRRMRIYLAPKVLIVDEFGIWPNDSMDSERLLHDRGSKHGPRILGSRPG